MYNCIIVDDEGFVLNSLSKIIDWNQNGFEVKGLFTDAEKALDFVRKNKVNLVLTDIRMPVMDGLTFSEAVYNCDPDIKIILISGYEDFEAAKRALDIKVMAYLLKPTRYNELLNAVQNAKQTLDNMQEDEDISPLIVRQFLFDIYTGALQNEEVIKKRLMSINVDPDSIGKPCVLARFNVKDYNEYLKNIWSHGVDGFCTALFQIFQQQSNGLFVSVFNLVGDTFLAVVLSNGDIADLPSARRIFDKAVGNVKEILCAEISYTILGEYPELLKLAAVQPKDSKEEFCGTICHYMGIGNINEIENILNIGKEYFSGIPLNDVKDFVKLTFARLDEMYESIGDFSEEIENEINDIMAIDNFESVWELFTGSLCDLALRTQKFSKNNGNAIAKRAKEYVNQNYNLDVSLEGLSKILCLEPTYVSKLFKKETGQNFIDYLISVRMEKAKELLESTNHKVYTISMSVGYKKIKYFYKVFKKYTGYTPTEYRNMLFGGGEEK